MVLSFRKANQIVISLVGSSEVAHQWWHSHNLAFDHKTPYEQWLIDSEVVSDYLLNYVFK